MKKMNEQVKALCDLAASGSKVASVTATAEGFLKTLGAVRSHLRSVQTECAVREKFVAGNLVIQFYKLDGEGAGSITMTCAASRIRNRDVVRGWDDAEDWLLETRLNEMSTDQIIMEDTDG